MNVYTLRLSGPGCEWMLGAYSHPQLAQRAAETHAAEAYQTALDWHHGEDGDASAEVKRQKWSDYYSVDRKELDAEAWP